MTRDRDTIDRELHLLAVVRAAVRELGGEPTTGPVDQLLDERVSSVPLTELSTPT